VADRPLIRSISNVNEKMTVRGHAPNTSFERTREG